MTERGQGLATFTNGMSWARARPLWDSVSRQFAQGASGEAHVFVNVEAASEGSIWATTELPALVENRGISDVIFHLIGGGV